MGKQGSVLLLQLTVVWAAATMAAPAAAQAKPGCPDRCSNVSIPYPFGTREGCYLSEEFLITCNHTTTSPPKAFLTESKISVTNVTLQGELQVLTNVVRYCYNTDGTLTDSNIGRIMSLPAFSLSGARNKLVTVGCNTFAALYAPGEGEGQVYRTVCSSTCSSLDEVMDGSCTGAGCCQMSLIDGLTDIYLIFRSIFNNSYVWEFNPCSYSFLVDAAAFNFSSKSLNNSRDVEKLPMVIDWSIGNESCTIAQGNQTTYACKEKSTCYESRSRSGYLCKCLPGYQGNPYLDGCTEDIDECHDPSLNKCVKKARCQNIPGNYTCSCPTGYRGDGRQDGEGCLPIKLQIIRLALALGIGAFLGALLLVFCARWLYRVLKRRRETKHKEKCFKSLVEQRLSSSEGNVDKTKLFTFMELKKATNHYNENRVIGRGGQGTVYKGMLMDGRIVAVKKLKIVGDDELEQFINEVVILSQINHRNVVKLLGCCLETEVPILVYEFIPNGNLSEHIHNQNEEPPMTWEMRLRIATEVAGALSYLHSAASMPIYHRDIKSTNILLDDKYRAKVADFGTSKSIAIDQTHLTTIVQGTLGYLDPEYFQSGQFTDKSDVYSFGVVLLELLTGKKPILSTTSEEGKSLVTHFILSMEEDHLSDLLDARVLNEGKNEEINATAFLARQCINSNGRKRPTMKEVAMELERIKTFQGELHPEQISHQEAEYDTIELNGSSCAGSTSTRS